MYTCISPFILPIFTDIGTKVTRIQPMLGVNGSQILEEWEKVLVQSSQQELSDQPQGRSLFTTVSAQSSPGSGRLSASSSFCPSPASVQCPFTPPSLRRNVPFQPITQVCKKRMSAPTTSASISSNNVFKLHQSTLVEKCNTNMNSGKVQFNKCSTIPQKHTKIPAPENPTTMPVKKPKISSVPHNTSRSTMPSTFSVPSDANKAIVDSILEGIDTDSFFDDF